MDQLLPLALPAPRRRLAQSRKSAASRDPVAQAGEDSLAPRDRQGWAIRLRDRAGFGWGPPRLAPQAYFAWHDVDCADLALDELAPRVLGVAVYPSWSAAERRAAVCRSRSLSARPVAVWIRIRMRAMP